MSIYLGHKEIKFTAHARNFLVEEMFLMKIVTPFRKSLWSEMVAHRQNSVIKSFLFQLEKKTTQDLKKFLWIYPVKMNGLQQWVTGSLISIEGEL